jgi:hypothetical protein
MRRYEFCAYKVQAVFFFGACGAASIRFSVFHFVLLPLVLPIPTFLFAVTYMKSDDEGHLVFTADRSTGRVGFDTNYIQRCVNMR